MSENNKPEQKITIELTNSQVNFLITLINASNISGKDVEFVVDVKKELINSQEKKEK